MNSLQTAPGRSVGNWCRSHYYVLPENKDKAPRLIEEQKKYLAFMEKYCGPFPFRTIRAGIVETPHLGMEHSTAIAYGNKYRFASDGFRLAPASRIWSRVVGKLGFER